MAPGGGSLPAGRGPLWSGALRAAAQPGLRLGCPLQYIDLGELLDADAGRGVEPPGARCDRGSGPWRDTLAGGTPRWSGCWPIPSGWSCGLIPKRP